jgi:lysozyme
VRPVWTASLLVLAVAGTLFIAPAPATAAPADMLPGIDVSQWQGTVDWAKVGSSDVRFVIMRATRGAAYLDPMYGTNLTGASAHGLVVGAYHRAKPAGAPGDAEAEADHFVQVARNAPGDLVPALDIEERGGLSVAGLQDWVRTWLARVRSKLGVRPMVYTSPYFWRTAMGDSQWFAQNGYVVWVAHWGVNRQNLDVPAQGWAGGDWTFWQYTNRGRVAGIAPAVDRDRFNGTNLHRAEIAELTVTPSGGGTVTGARITCSASAIHCARLANPGDVLTLTATPDPGATFLRWTGACAPAGSSPTCDVTALGSVSTEAVFGYPVTVAATGTGAGQVTSDPSGIACGSTCSAVYAYGRQVTLAASPDSASGFGAWGGACAGANPDLACTVTVTSPTHVSVRFDAAVELAENGAGTRFSWGRVADPRAIGGSYLLEHRAGASATFGFAGGTVTVFTIAGPAMGRANVRIDGAYAGTLNGYAPTFRSGVAHRFGRLGGGRHIVTITALGTAAPHAAGTRVGIDAIQAAGVLHPNPKPGAGAWGSIAAGSALDGAYVVSDLAGASARLRFTGTGATWITVLGPSMGQAQIWVDGKLVRTIGLYAKTTRFGVRRGISGLRDGHHVLRIVVLSTRGAHSTGTSVAVDGWIIR